MRLDMTTGSVASDEYLREVVKKWSDEQNRGRLYAICCWNGSHAKFVRSLLVPLPHVVQAIGGDKPWLANNAYQLCLANCAHVLISAGSADFWRGRYFAEALLVRAGGHWELQKAAPASTTLKGHVPEESLQKLKEEWAKQMANGTTWRIPIVVNPDAPPNQVFVVVDGKVKGVIKNVSKDPDPVPFALQASTWETKHDPRMGAYKERIVEKHRGGCFECSAPIDGPARERQRGGTVWHLHAVCPEPPKKARKR